MNWARHLIWLAAAAAWGQAPGTVPVGAILAWYGDPATLPAEWRLCDGALVSDPESPLAGRRLPDLRGRFLRGADCCRPGDGAGELGGQDEAPAHSHPFSAATNNVRFGPESVAGWRGAETLHEGTPARGKPKPVAALTVPSDAAGRGPWPSHGHIAGSASFSGATANAGGHDNRPRFVSVHFVIRIK